MTDLQRDERTPTGMELLAELARKTDDPTVAVAVAQSIVALQQNVERFSWEREERQARIDFDDALNRCQARIGRIAPNQHRSDTRSWWADYAELDRTIRPIYTQDGFSISFSEVAPVAVGKVRIKADLSRGGISKEYFSEITPTTVGPKGNAMATPTDADAIALARAKRYLMLSIFNIAVGIDALEKDGVTEDALKPWLEKLAAAKDSADLNRISLEAIKAVRGDTGAVQQIGQAKNKRIKELKGDVHA